MATAAIVGLIVGIAMSVAGSVASVYDTYQNGLKERNDLRQQQKASDAAAERQWDTDQLEFSTGKADAAKSADETDAQTGVAETSLESSYNTALSDLGLGMQSQAEQNRASHRSDGLSESADEAAVTASGVRAGGSNTQAAAQNAEYTNGALERSMKIQDATNQNSLEKSYLSFLGSQSTLQSARTNAYDLRSSYEAGGTKRLLYLNDLYNVANAKYWSDKSYEHAIDDATPNGWDYVSSWFGGGNLGAQTGYSFYQYYSQLSGASATSSASA
jgi:hypothetical protein